MDIRNLKLIQDGLRNPASIHDMINFVKANGIYGPQTIGNYLGVEPNQNLIMEIAEFPDGEFYIHNGNHRCVSLYLGGRHKLHPHEYRIKQWSYEDYNTINFLKPDGTWLGYVTPFDVRSEARVAELGPFKTEVEWIYYSIGEEAARNFIYNNVSLYKRKKRLFTVKQLAWEWYRNNNVR